MVRKLPLGRKIGDSCEWLNGSLVIALRVFCFATRLLTTRQFNNDDFWRVSADTKTCGSPLYVSLLTNKGVLYHIIVHKSSRKGS